MALNLSIDPRAEHGPLTQQLAQALRDAITAGDLARGDRLPASRVLATDLGLARATVTTALNQLVAEGLLEARPGAGTFVATDAWVQNSLASIAADFVAPVPVIAPADVDARVTSTIDLRPCRPSMELFPRAEWRRCLADAGQRTPSSDYGDARGAPELRQSIAAYLRRARGLACNADNILITNGSVHAMHLLAKLYVQPGEAVLFEEPGYPLARQTFQLAGAKLLPAPVDNDGINPAGFDKWAIAARLVYVTPSHQFPTGGRLSLGRRRALIGWAEQQRAIIVEDDYDSEFRFDVPPLAPLASLPNRCVVYCGTFSKTLSPELRIGYAVAPPEVIERLATLRTQTDYAPNMPVQLALNQFIAKGYFDTHVHRCRRLYANKRKALVAALMAAPWDAQVQGLQSGLNALVRIKASSANRIAARALREGICVLPLGRYYMDSNNAADDALVLGYAQPNIAELRSAVATLARLAN